LAAQTSRRQTQPIRSDGAATDFQFSSQRSATKPTWRRQRAKRAAEPGKLASGCRSLGPQTLGGGRRTPIMALAASKVRPPQVRCNGIWLRAGAGERR